MEAAQEPAQALDGLGRGQAGQVVHDDDGVEGGEGLPGGEIGLGVVELPVPGQRVAGVEGGGGGDGRCRLVHTVYIGSQVSQKPRALAAPAPGDQHAHPRLDA